jgi:esterase/lipase
MKEIKYSKETMKEYIANIERLMDSFREKMNRIENALCVLQELHDEEFEKYNEMKK